MRGPKLALYSTSTTPAYERLHMLPKTHEVKRPRLALSCVLCRRRKVKCGKELPQCRNCERLGEACVYNTGTRDPLTGRVLRVAEDDIRENTETLLHNGDGQSLPHEDLIRRDGQGNDPELEVLENERVLPPEHLSIQQGSRYRYIGRSFWASVSGQEKLNEFFHEPEGPTDLPPPHISPTLVVKSLHALPTKPRCDVLLDLFLFSVHPIYPLIDAPIFQSDYHEFWEWCRKGDFIPPARLMQDPTFISLLFSVLLAGASVASDVTWYTTALQSSDKHDLVNQLRAACLETLDACQYARYPTLNTLMASILAHHFTKKESLESAIFVGTAFRLAQSMGLHQEWNLEIPDLQNRRRVWWYIVWLDVQASISTGLHLCCGSDMLGGVQMPPGTDEPPDDASVTMLYVTGLYKAAKLQSQIIRHFEGARTISQNEIAELAASKDQLHRSIDGLISRICVQGFPERGMFPSRFTNASPQTLPSLYNDQSKDPSILGAWARIMLSLLKLETTIILQKPLLEPSDSPTAQPAWKSTAQLCLQYLEMYLHLRTPIFEPYAWFFPRCHGPRQCVLLILLFLLNYRQSNSEEERAMIFCVDETLEYCASRQDSFFSHDEQTDAQSTFEGLVRLRKEVDGDSQRY